jgi:hypothetical protein
MNEFRTIVSPSIAKAKTGLNTSFLTIGSCFSDAIGSRLSNHKFPTEVNPFGVIYNPLSIHRSLIHSIFEQVYAEKDYLKSQDLYLNYQLHSSFSDLNRAELLKRVEETVQRSHTFLRRCRYLLITYGTAWVYKLKETGDVVANCHKQPSSLFEKKLLQVSEIIDSFREMNKYLMEVNKDIRIILTLSPVRHLKDTAELNSVSKAICRTACHYLTEEFAHVEYFPAYEIMMDDLRDYRFYKSGMIHPNDQAEEYIWNRFIDTYMNEDSKKFIIQWSSIRRALEHRPFHPSSSGHQIFLKQVLEKLGQLKHIVNVDAEIRLIEAQLNSHQVNSNRIQQ